MDFNTVITTTIGAIGWYLIITGIMTAFYFLRALANGGLSIKTYKAYHNANETIESEKNRIREENIGKGITGEEIEELQETFIREFIKKVEESTQLEYEQLRTVAKFFSFLISFLIGLLIVGVFWLLLFINQ